MSSDPFVTARLNAFKTREAWRSTIIASRPQVMVTLATNSEMGEQKLERLVRRALLDLDVKRLGNRKRPEKLSAISRTCGFIFFEKVGLNSHAHVMIYSPTLLHRPDSELAKNISDTRIRHDFIGKSGQYDPGRFRCNKDACPRLEKFWRSLVPGGHYHARWTDENVERGVDYVLKEVPWHPERGVRITQEFWPSRQHKLDRTLPVARDLH